MVNRVRRTSGEIVALTMMEVFLTFLFMILTFTSIRESESASLDEKLRHEQERAANLESEIDRLRRESEVLVGERDEARRRTEKLQRKYDSEFAPLCPQVDKFIIEVILHGDDRLEVVFNQDSGDGRYRRGTRVSMSSGQFRTYFAPLYRESVRSGCRYSAIMRDTPTIDKAELLHLQKLVREFFYAEIR
jgi:hypothetical protein